MAQTARCPTGLITVPSAVDVVTRPGAGRAGGVEGGEERGGRGGGVILVGEGTHCTLQTAHTAVQCSAVQCTLPIANCSGGTPPQRPDPVAATVLASVIS